MPPDAAATALGPPASAAGADTAHRGSSVARILSSSARPHLAKVGVFYLFLLRLQFRDQILRRCFDYWSRWDWLCWRHRWRERRIGKWRRGVAWRWRTSFLEGLDDVVVVVAVVIAEAEAVVWAGARVEDAVYREWMTEKVDVAVAFEHNN